MWNSSRFVLRAVVALLVIAYGPSTWASAPVRCSEETQQRVALTIYNEDLGLVRDVRRVELKKGPFLMEFMDVAEKIDPTSVFLKSLTHPGKLTIFEQNYEFDLITPRRLMEKAQGQKVTLLERIDNGTREKRTEAVLLSTNSGNVYRIGEEIHLGHPGEVLLPAMPEGLYAKPTLLWLLHNEGDSPQTLEVSYLTRGISWRSDYVAVVDEKERFMDITCWVTIRNESGTSYRDADIKLVAGDVKQVREQEPRHAMLKMAMESDAGPSFDERTFFEYHLYALNRTTTIKNNQIKQMALLTANETPVEKEYLFRAPRGFRGREISDVYKDRAEVELVFRNEASSNLGMPLPKGKVRIYKADVDGTVQFIGEDSLDHTPKDEEVRLEVGKAFDVVVERRQTNYNRLSPTVLEESYEIQIRNHKEEAVKVTVEEPMQGDWQITRSNREWNKKGAFTAVFEVEARPGQVETVKYTSVVKR
jgi:hypothetical protein